MAERVENSGIDESVATGNQQRGFSDIGDPQINLICREEEVLHELRVMTQRVLGHKPVPLKNEDKEIP